jgi:hypothetical protein
MGRTKPVSEPDATAGRLAYTRRSGTAPVCGGMSTPGSGTLSEATEHGGAR